MKWKIKMSLILFLFVFHPSETPGFEIGTIMTLRFSCRCHTDALTCVCKSKRCAHLCPSITRVIQLWNVKKVVLSLVVDKLHFQKLDIATLPKEQSIINAWMKFIFNNVPERLNNKVPFRSQTLTPHHGVYAFGSAISIWSRCDEHTNLLADNSPWRHHKRSTRKYKSRQWAFTCVWDVTPFETYCF